jgi:DNA-directed RNA polymerase subunit RPC12/RpoP
MGWLEQIEQEQHEKEYGRTNELLMCPHCQTRGMVRTKQTKVKRGISGGKATGAVLTAGLSILATGLSRKEQVTQAHCDNCGSTWAF